MANDSQPGLFTNIVNLVKALAWPLLVACILLAYGAPLSETIKQLPDLVKNATKVSAGGFSVEVDRKAQESGNGALANALKGLSPNSRRALMQIGISHFILWGKSGLTPNSYYSSFDPTVLKEMYDRHLIAYREDPLKFDQFLRSLGSVNTTIENGQQKQTLTASRPLTADEEKRLLQQEVTLSTLGMQAYNVILDVVVHS